MKLKNILNYKYFKIQVLTNTDKVRSLNQDESSKIWYIESWGTNLSMIHENANIHSF